MSLKQDITKYFIEIYLKMTQWGMIFQIIAAVVSKVRILLPLTGKNTLQKQPPGVLEICVWQLLLKSFKNVYELAN